MYSKRSPAGSVCMEKKLLFYIRSLISGREIAVLSALLISVFTVSAAILFSIDKYVFIYFGDAASHIVRARQFIDSQQPGIYNIGTVWLPVPHLVLLPLTLIDTLFYSGIAGTISGAVFLTGTCICLYLIIRETSGSVPAAFGGALLFGLNPNVLYICMAPMNEASLFFFIVLGGYMFMRWLKNGSDNLLMACSISVMIATLCRYEAWAIVPFIIFISAERIIPALKMKQTKRSMHLLLIAVVCSGGIMAWLMWNHFAYDDFIKFARWTYSIAPDGERGLIRKEPFVALFLFVRAILNIFGIIPFIFAAAGLTYLLKSKDRHNHFLLFIYFLLPVLFIMLSVMSGFVLIDKWQWNWRFMLILGLFLSVAAGTGLASAYRMRIPATIKALLFAALLSMPVIQMTDSTVGVAVYNDARRIFTDSTKYATFMGERLQKYNTGGKKIALITGYGLAQRIMITSRLPLKNFRIIYNPAKTERMEPSTISERYVVLGKDSLPETSRVLARWMSERNKWIDNFSILYEDRHYMLLERRLPDAHDN